MLKILHTADFRVGTKFSSLTEELAKTATELQMLAISNMVKTANLKEIDIMLIAGDTFDGHNVSFNTRKELFDILGRFWGKIFIVCGNQDFYYQDSIWDHTALPENVVLFKSNQMAKYETETYAVYGVSFNQGAEQFDINDIDLSMDKINICLMHGDMHTGSKINPVKSVDIATSRFDYVALGHNLSFTEIRKASDTYYACSGSISATGFDETVEKVYILGTLDKKGCSFIAKQSNGLKMTDIEIDITDIEKESEVVKKLLKYTGENVYLNVTLEGVTKKAIDEKIIKDEILHEFFNVEICNNTVQKENVWRYISDSGLLGEYTRLMHDKFEKADDQDQIIEALKLGIEALKN